MGLPLHPEDVEGPTTSLTILGVELVSAKVHYRLPQEKATRIIALLEVCSLKQFCRRKQLESFISHFHHVCKIASHGWTFLRCMISVLCEFRLDLLWWQELFHVRMVWAYSLPQHGLSFKTSRFHLMLRGLLVMVLSFRFIGFAAHCRHPRFLSPLPTSIIFRWLWLLTCGAPPGLLGELNFCAIMKL